VFFLNRIVHKLLLSKFINDPAIRVDLIKRMDSDLKNGVNFLGWLSPAEYDRLLALAFKRKKRMQHRSIEAPKVITSDGRAEPRLRRGRRWAIHNVEEETGE